MTMVIDRPEDYLFKMKDKTDEPTTGSPVNDQKNRVNLFEDDGTIASDISTPDFTPSSRSRTAYKPVDQFCERCNKSFAVNPKHVREFFVCDRCLSK
tara:strand:+ start:418 stop:708 length:291 start_codon:yes stop_codon:yes gene_type:complete